VKPTLRIKIVSGFLVVAMAAVAVGLVGSRLVASTHNADERSAGESLQRVVTVGNAQVSLLMGEVFGSGLIIYGRNDALTTQMVDATKSASHALAMLGRYDLSPAARHLHTSLVTSHSSLVKLENSLFALDLPVPDPGAPTLKLENMGQMQEIQNTIAQTAEALRQQISKDATEARVRTTADADHELTILLWVVALVAVGIVGFGVWFSGRLVRRIKSTAHVLERVAEGDLTPRCEEGGDDEVAEMGAALNATLGTVQEVMSELETDAGELSAFAEQASAQSATASAAANQISGYVRTMRVATATMAEHAERLASSAELGSELGPELTREIVELAHQARRVAEGMGDQGLGKAADVSAVIVARNRAAADRMARMAGTLNAMIGTFVIE
jgi:methyl-accepting chemotaxis protein